jgi:hypothetical protein
MRIRPDTISVEKNGGRGRGNVFGRSGLLADAAGGRRCGDVDAFWFWAGMGGAFGRRRADDRARIHVEAIGSISRVTAWSTIGKWGDFW